MRACLKAFIKPFEALQRSAKIKNSYFNTNARVRKGEQAVSGSAKQFYAVTKSNVNPDMTS